MKNLNSVLFVLVSVISTACGNINSGSQQIGSSSYSYGTQTGNSYNTSTASQCSASPNVYGQSLNSGIQNQYRACNAGAANTVKLFAEDESVKTVCIYPVKVNGNQIAIFPQVAKCVTTNAAGNTANFSNVGMNAIYVVDAAAVGAFNACITYSAQGGSLAACAASYNISGNYSYGQFQ